MSTITDFSAARRPSSARPARGRRAGRPRHTGQSASTAPRDDILDHAARLFTTRGYAGTSTRDIAEAVGIRQSSLYYHFADKAEILSELLDQTIRPTIDKVEEIESLAAEHGWETVLYVLVLVDVHTLAVAPHNAGMLPRLPDVTRQPLFDRSKTVRRELIDAYDRIASRFADRSDHDLHLGNVLLQLVEVVISIRRSGDTFTDTRCHAIAASALRICDVPEEQIWTAALTAERVVGQFT
ncbi:TetR/AcrR family transcriptional regulator [Nocardioides albus]|uniref:AcrR family transcriptional regulator n=1 Tax=Nocardioides albus TaxID=1841 RepID=A0A7W5F766_9ACTN|nr:TetR/AcrR family transcriptional regulator [Nocardioides albus]MBB3087522.1 AcrR family transcriptional regulator [Nocardioides albus]GGU09607.1 TetR family transcriptional regulator [Nocardioides albus]